jgi:hypothetical protein
MFSSVTAGPISAQELDGSYWIKNMVSTVRFSEAVKALVSQIGPAKTRRKVAIAYAAAIEIGPAAAFQGPLMQILTAHDDRLVGSIMYTSLLSRGTSAEASALNAAGRLWAQGNKLFCFSLNCPIYSLSYDPLPVSFICEPKHSFFLRTQHRPSRRELPNDTKEQVSGSCKPATLRMESYKGILA